MTNSFKAAIGSTLIAVVLGTLAGVALARRPGKWTIGFVAILLLILTTPEIVDAIGLQLWFVRLGEHRSARACCPSGSASRSSPRRW